MHRYIHVCAENAGYRRQYLADLLCQGIEKLLALLVFRRVGAIGTEAAIDAPREHEVGYKHNLAANSLRVLRKLALLVDKNAQARYFICHF